MLSVFEWMVKFELFQFAGAAHGAASAFQMDSNQFLYESQSPLFLNYPFRIQGKHPSLSLIVSISFALFL